jgi:hypothetical protein
MTHTHIHRYAYVWPTRVDKYSYIHTNTHMYITFNYTGKNIYTRMDTQHSHAHTHRRGHTQAYRHICKHALAETHTHSHAHQPADATTSAYNHTRAHIFIHTYPNTHRQATTLAYSLSFLPLSNYNPLNLSLSLCLSPLLSASHHFSLRLSPNFSPATRFHSASLSPSLCISLSLTTICACARACLCGGMCVCVSWVCSGLYLGPLPVQCRSVSSRAAGLAQTLSCYTQNSPISTLSWTGPSLARIKRWLSLRVFSRRGRELLCSTRVCKCSGNRIQCTQTHTNTLTYTKVRTHIPKHLLLYI